MPQSSSGLARLLLATLALAPLLPLTTRAADDTAAPGGGILERIVVTATPLGHRTMEGSVQFIDEDQLERHGHGDINRVLRQVPGLNLVEEEGFGIRPNIGIRGSGTNRNSKIAVLEDGIAIAPAPYAAPAAYYFPRVTRMQGVEVSKGPAAIKYGPQTVAGAIGFYSTPIPDGGDDRPGGRLDVLAGNFGSTRVHGQVGGYTATARGLRIGLGVETLRERSDGFKTLDDGGDTGFAIDDHVVKLAIESADGARLPQSLELKFQHSDEDSNETYLGLGRSDFDATPYRRYRASQNDHLDVKHQTLQASHRIELGRHMDLTTVLYQTDTERTWYKLNDVRNAADTGWVSLKNILADTAAFPVEYAALVGAPGDSSAPGALRVRNNHRSYQAKGIQSVLGIAVQHGPFSHDIDASLRYHEDEEDRYQNDDRYQMSNGSLLLTQAGSPGSQDNRLGEAEAWAAYLRDEIAFGRWTLVPGLRYERIRLTQRNWGSGDPGRNGAPATRRNTVDVLLPGLGATWRLDEHWSFFGGVHRGFINPAPGSDSDAEKSWNYEAGTRYAHGALTADATAFLVDYRNLVGTCTASTGGDCNIGDQFDGGRARVHGLEFRAGYDAAALFDSPWSLPMSLAWTWTRSEFRNSFSSSFGEWGTVSSGDELPYIPDHQLTLNAGIEAGNFRLHVTANHVDETRAQAGDGPVPAAQRIESRMLVDVSGEIDLNPAVSLWATVENITDEIYNVALRPAGYRPGAPRTVMAGIKMRF